MNYQVKKAITISILIGLIGALTSIGMFSLSGFMLSKSVLNVPLYTLMTLVATIKLFGVLRAVCKYFERLISHEATFEMLKDIRVNAVKDLLQNFEQIQANHKLSNVLNMTVNNIEKLQNKLLRVIYPPVIALLTTITVIFIYIQYSLYAVIVIGIAMILMIIILPRVCTTILKNAVIEKYKAIDHYESKLVDYHLHKETIRLFDNNRVFEMDLDKLQHEMENRVATEHLVITLYDFMLNLIAMTAIFLTIALMIIDPSLQVMMYLSIVMVTITIFEMAIPMVHYPYHKVETKLAEESIQSLTKSSVEKLNVQMESIELENVNVIKTRKILNDINIKIKKGDWIGISGQSGAGKTTLIQTIIGLNNITGRYIINGKPIDCPVNMFDMWNISSQQNHFIEGTVMENMFTQVSNQRLESLLKQFNLPFNADSNVDAFGSNLSGGERQRLHFIRMILRNKSLWILDEPFNGLDESNIQIMMDYLKEQSITLILISHDTRYFQYVDEVYVLSSGNIIERGRFEQLYKNKTSLFHALSKK
ncbi:ATP-binding cassette domain-containing protein [Macrococcus armenti]|uniref:ATP-binding cassette domain-containing protein n=1 Tax=Macrococcus armenti TaxID=2875764 RepID=UPI001CCA590D|nr:ATP-binding cassette domain-containing protein [Macrococcus armenti]UBH23439.1 ATP-binding cassette domain-containing protein [Macrococcus armenti]